MKQGRDPLAAQLPHPPKRRGKSGNRISAFGPCLGLLLGLLPTTLGATPQVSRQLDAAVERFLASSLQQEAARQGWRNMRFSHKSTPLSRTAQLAPCPQPLQVSSDSTIGPGRQRLQVRCPDGWTVMVNSEVSVVISAVGASQVIERNTQLGAEHLTEVDLDISKAPGGFFSQPEAVIGKSAKRRIRAGQVLNPSLLVAPLLVRRGQAVKIIATMEGISASAPGEALENGELGAVIRVRNTRSQKEIDAKVVEEGVVSSTF